MFAFVFTNCVAQPKNNIREITYVVVPIELREQVKEYVLRKANAGLEEMVLSARNNEEIPNEMLFLVDIAKNIFVSNGLPIPDSMDTRTVLEAFASRLEALFAIETYYRNEIFELFYSNKDEAFRLFDFNSINSSVENIFEKSNLTFHILDYEATEAFNNYYKANPTTTFDVAGNLINPMILPPDVIVLGVFKKDQYGLDEQERIFDGGLRYSVIKREIGLDGNHIRSAMVDRNPIDERPEITFMLDNVGGEIFYNLTSKNIGNVLAIVLDGKIRTQATIQAAIKDAVRMTGFDIEESESLAQMLRNR
jgi:preprotein translocase subunit SecD